MAIVAFLGAWLSMGVGFLIGVRVLLPFLNAIAVYPFYLGMVLSGRRRNAVVFVLLWAVFMSQAAIVGTYLFPKRASQVIIRGETYREEMFEWVATGNGTESSPRQFIPRHLEEFGLFCVVAFVTAGFGALFLGAVLLNYMNYYVATLVAASAHPVATLFLAWQPYAIIRVGGYVFMGTALAETFTALVAKRGLRSARVKVYAATGFALVLVDILLKALTAPPWSRLLRWLTGLGAG